MGNFKGCNEAEGGGFLFLPPSCERKEAILLPCVAEMARSLTIWSPPYRRRRWCRFALRSNDMARSHGFLRPGTVCAWLWV